MPLLVRVKSRFDRPVPTGSYYRSDAKTSSTSPTTEGHDVARDTTAPSGSTSTPAAAG